MRRFRWPLYIIGLSPLTLTVYISSYSWRARRAIDAFETKWQPVIGPFVLTDHFPAIANDEDLAKDLFFIEQVEYSDTPSWALAQLAGIQPTTPRSFWKQASIQHDEDNLQFVDLKSWYPGGDSLTEKQIALRALEKLQQHEPRLAKARQLLSSYSKISSPLLSSAELETDRLFLTKPRS